jgi:hypothetical protein
MCNIISYEVTNMSAGGEILICFLRQKRLGRIPDDWDPVCSRLTTFQNIHASGMFRLGINVTSSRRERAREGELRRVSEAEETKARGPVYRILSTLTRGVLSSRHACRHIRPTVAI